MKNALKIGTGILGGGAAVYLTPSQGAGQTAEWDASDATKLFVDAGSTAVSADGDAVAQMNDQTANARHASEATNKPLYKVNRQNGLSGLYFDGSNDILTTAVPLSNFIANNAYTCYLVIKPIAITTNEATVALNDVPFADASGYFGVALKTAPTAHAYNYDGNYDSASGSITVGAAVLITFWHSGGSIYMQVNNGTPTSAASGNTSNLVGAMRWGRNYNGSAFCEYDFYQASVHNQVHDDATRDSINKGLIAKWGIGSESFL